MDYHGLVYLVDQSETSLKFHSPKRIHQIREILSSRVFIPVDGKKIVTRISHYLQGKINFEFNVNE